MITEASQAIGANNPPENIDIEILRERVTEHLASLGSKYKALWDEAADLELAAMLLPTEVKTDADEEAIRLHVGKEKALAAKIEKARKLEKDLPLEWGKQSDAKFAREGDPLAVRSKALTRRLDAFLTAKAAKVEADRRARAAELLAASQAAEKRLQEEQAEAARLLKEATDAAALVRAATTTEEREAATEIMRTAHEGARLATDAADQANKDVIQTARKAETQERIADRGGHARTSGGGVSANLATELDVQIDFQTVRKNCGTLGTFLTDEAIRYACTKAAKLEVVLDGVTVNELQRANIRATRS